MRRAVALAVLSLLAVVVIAQAQVQTEKPPIALDPSAEARYEALLPDLRCLVCQNQSLADSQAPLALGLRYEVRQQVAAGRSNEDIRKYLTDRYGEFVLYRPRFEPQTWALWGVPFLLAAIGLAVAGRQLRRRASAPAAMLDRAQLERLLADEDRRA